MSFLRHTKQLDHHPQPQEQVEKRVFPRAEVQFCRVGSIEKKSSKLTREVASRDSTIIEEVSEEADDKDMSHESQPLLLDSKDDVFVTNNNNLNQSTSYKSVTFHLHPSTDQSTSTQNIDDDSSSKIGYLGSFSLIINNLTGPGMLGFPNLFQNAGLIPVTISICFAWIASSLCGTLLADAIGSIRGNEDFSRQIDFSRAFRLIVGKKWYVLAEALFLTSCCVQACASIVAAAQSLDGFIASFLLGRTFGLQLYPEITMVSWDTSACHEETEFVPESDSEDCTPFASAGPLVLTFGFVLVSLLFLPLGLGHLKETIAVQIFSMVSMFVLLIQFCYEFIVRGVNYDIPWVGYDMSKLTGVVLFNYAFSITVPSWLSEKDRNVSVNKCVWTASSWASIIYMVFGLLGALAFDQVGPNVLVLLASNKVHHLTRFCAALFGVIIIGCGVPVFAVVIRTGLVASELCSPGWALFLGGFLPYFMSWMLYQGTMLMSILNWAGLVINGLVAFLFPMILALKAIELKARNPHDIQLTVTAQAPVTTSLQESPTFGTPSAFSSTSITTDDFQGDVELINMPASVSTRLMEAQAASRAAGHVKKDDDDRHPPALTLKNPHVDLMSSFSSASSSQHTSTHLDSVHGTVRKLRANTVVEPLPTFLDGFRREIIVFMIASFTVIILTTIIEDAISGVLLPL